MLNIATLHSPAFTKSESKAGTRLAQRGPAHHAIKRQEVQAAWALRAVDAIHASAMLIASGGAVGLSGELLEMQRAFVKQLHEMGHEWFQGLTAWTEECTEIKTANTLSKIIEQEFNLIGQFGQLLTVQATDLVDLMEGVQVGYGYWVKEKLQQL